MLMLVVMAITTLNAYSIDEQSYGEMGQLIYEKKAKELQAMLDAGANPNQLQGMITPLGIAVEWGRTECIEILLAHPKIEINTIYTVVVRGGSGVMTTRNALLSAINEGNFTLANKLIDMGIECDILSKATSLDGSFKEYHTPLTAIYYWDKKKEVVELAQRIADKTKNIDRVFSYSQYKKEMNALPDISLVQRLIGDDDDDRTIFNPVTISFMERGADFKRYFEISKTGEELVAQYMTKEEYAAYKALQKYITYNSCPLAAALRGNAEVLKYMIDNGAPISRYDDGGAVLFSTCTNIDCVKVLLDRGVDINTCHPSGWPLILTAATSENYDLIDGMLALGADPFIAVKGITIRETMRSYPNSRKKKLQKVYKKYGYDL